MIDPKVIDLRSDFVARPSAAVKEAVAAALLEAPAFDLREDRVQGALEEHAASIVGKEDALLFPTCTMANQVALRLHAKPGDAVICETDSHVVTSEAGAPAAIGGLSVLPVRGHRGCMDRRGVEAVIERCSRASCPAPRIILLENSHTRSGGCVLPLGYMEEMRAIARGHDLSIHLDGARLFNAAYALGQSPGLLAAAADTVSISLNKAPGAPLGAILAGSRVQIRTALRIRQSMGGGVRPTRIFAAAALAGLKEVQGRIARAHCIARQLAAELASIDELAFDHTQVESNILLVRSPRGHTPQSLLGGLRERNILALEFEAGIVRFVTHAGLEDDVPHYVGNALRSIIARTPSAQSRD